MGAGNETQSAEVGRCGFVTASQDTRILGDFLAIFGPRQAMMGRRRCPRVAVLSRLRAAGHWDDGRSAEEGMRRVEKEFPTMAGRRDGGMMDDGDRKRPGWGLCGTSPSTAKFACFGGGTSRDVCCCCGVQRPGFRECEKAWRPWDPAAWCCNSCKLPAPLTGSSSLSTPFPLKSNAQIRPCLFVLPNRTPVQILSLPLHPLNSRPSRPTPVARVKPCRFDSRVSAHSRSHCGGDSDGPCVAHGQILFSQRQSGARPIVDPS